MSEADIPALLAHRAPGLGWSQAGLAFEDVALDEVARASGTPVWVMGAATVRARFSRLADALARWKIGRDAIHYAIKANDRLAVLRLMAELGAGADAVSLGEIERALAAGMPAARIVFSGVGKTGEELAQAVRLGIGQINVESVEELRELAAIARAAGRVQRVALRVNPDIEAGGHDKISTGRAGDKFGLPAETVGEAYREAAGLEGVEPVGLAVHIGSQIMTAAPFERAASLLASLIAAQRAAGLAVSVADAGGGLGISYGAGPDGNPDAFAAALGGSLGGLGVRVTVEPGRWLVGPAGVLVSRVIRVKEAATPFLILDAAMNDLARPSLYDAWHGIVPVAPRPGERRYDVVGPVCESGDVLARARMLPTCQAGDLVAILDTGAYGAVMSSTYNARPLASEVMVDRGSWQVIRRRQAVDELWREEVEA